MAIFLRMVHNSLKHCVIFLNFPIVLIWILRYRNNLGTSVLDLDSLHPELDPGILLNPDPVW